MKAVQVPSPEADFETVDRAAPEPGDGQALVRVKACGICHSDVFVKDGLWPGIEYPRVPGHEVAGVIERLGSNIRGDWSEGQRVGIGWHGGHCLRCNRCRRGDFTTCENGGVTGITHDGGYAEHVVAPEESLVSMPDELDFAEAAPLLCAGITVFNALRNSTARPGDTVAIQGIGGLGHLGVQVANRMGFRTVALSRGPDKEPLARELGAHEYVDATQGDPAEALQDLGGASVLLATAPHARTIDSVVGGLAVDGELLIVAAPGNPLSLGALDLIAARRRVQGWPSGTPADAEDTLRFCALTGVRARIETQPLSEAPTAYRRMMANEARFRMVLVND